MKLEFIVLFSLVGLNASAGSLTVYERSVDQNLDTSYKRVYKALEANSFKRAGSKVIKAVEIGLSDAQ